MFQRVAIIGGGAAGASLLSELLERPLSQPLHLDWFTGPGTPGRGVAYGTASERHLLNVRAASMGMFANRPGGFLQYVQQRDSSVNGTDFLPRRWYGDYLESEVANAIERTRAQGHSVRLVPYNVEAVVPEEDGVTLFQGETATHVEAAVLALGALAPRPLPQVSDDALASGRYVIDPWALLREARDSTQPQHVLVIGMGLTAVDAIVELAAKWPNARFTCISRHGLLPEQHLQQAALPFEDAAELVEGMQDAPDIRVWLRMLREAITHAPDWRHVVDCLRPYSATLWGLLPNADRARFMRHARWAWERVRHRLPPQVGASIRALEQSGRLSRLAGRMQDVSLTDNGLRMRYRPRYASSEVTIDADLIVQSVGLETNVSRAHDPLLQQMMTNGHIQADPLGLGLATMPDGRVLHKGEPWQRLFAMGSLVRGALWECTAMPEIRQQSRHLADLLLMDHDEDDD